LLFIEELSFLLNDQKKRNKPARRPGKIGTLAGGKKSPANILDYPVKKLKVES
jgi:hypothetical protein